MMFWIICFVLTALVGLRLITPLVRPPTAVAEDPQVALYKAQIEEVDRDVAREVLAADEADRAKTEIARRLLAATSGKSATTTSPFGRVAAIATAVVLLVLSIGLYAELGAPGYPDLPLQTRIADGDEFRENRPSQDEAEAAAPILEVPDFPADYVASVDQLRTLVPLRPSELEGWELLVFHESQMRDYAAAADAQAQVVAIKGDNTTTEDLVKLVDMMAAGTDGYVSPEAEIVVRRLLELNPNSIPGRYYLGAMYNQTDRPDLAFRLWRSILDSGASETFHLALARRFVSDAAMRAGTSYTPPEATQVAIEDVLNNGDLDDAAREEMIQGMVSGLAERLADQGGPVNQWARLIIAYSVLGQTEDARAILAEARDVFGASDEAVALLNDAAERAGINE